MADEREPAPEIPTPEVLSYDSKDVDLSSSPVDWEMTSPDVWERMSHEERENVLREQHRRLYFALQETGRVLDKVVPPEDGVSFSEIMNKLLNPDQYPLTHERPEVEP
jgi:hypothetical protein